MREEAQIDRALGGAIEQILNQGLVRWFNRTKVHMLTILGLPPALQLQAARARHRNLVGIDKVAIARHTHQVLSKVRMGNVNQRQSALANALAVQVDGTVFRDHIVHIPARSHDPGSLL